MRRKDREITDLKKICEVMEKCSCLHLGLNDNGKVYIVPLNYGYVFQNNKFTIFIHGANEGRKVDLIRNNPMAGFEMECGCELKRNATACDHTMRFQAIIGEGKVSIIDDLEEKKMALIRIMLHNTGKGDWDFPEVMLRKTYAFRIDVENISCKIHK